MQGLMTPPSFDSLAQYDVSNPNATVVTHQPLYDFQPYPTTGQLQLNFFQTPIGQGTTSAPGASGGKTKSDTNMEMGGALPTGNTFLATGIMVVFFPGTAVNNSGAFATTGLNWQDVWAVNKSGLLTFSVGTQNELTDGPIMKFPPNFRLGGAAAMADASTAAADLHSQIDYASSAGQVYPITPTRLVPQQNFKVTIDWPALVTVSAAGRIGVILDGFWYRWSQ
jgi:hypothetical protein